MNTAIPPPSLSTLQHLTWEGSLPLRIRLAPGESRSYDKTDPYLTHAPRLTYLPFLLPRLHGFFANSLIEDAASVAPEDGWFSFEGVPLKWHYPVGLLYDLFSGADASVRGEGHGLGLHASGLQEHPGGAVLPWELEVHFSDWPEEQLVRLDAEGRVMEDAFINGVKEADFLRNGTAKGIMSLSKDDSTRFWRAVQDHDFTMYNSVNQKLLNPPGAILRNIPLKIYLPSSSLVEGDAIDENATEATAQQGSLRVVQSPIPPALSERSALQQLLPSLFPSRRTATLARAVLHGTVLPLTAPLEEVMRSAAYMDGWIHLSVMMMG
ncbi:MAG: autophagy protein 5 [Thelocarpon superellum]|nr:MAG: autophagy protein 5 [Thelocarpon superellum]